MIATDRSAPSDVIDPLQSLLHHSAEDRYQIVCIDGRVHLIGNDIECLVTLKHREHPLYKVWSVPLWGTTGQAIHRRYATDRPECVASTLFLRCQLSLHFALPVVVKRLDRIALVIERLGLGSAAEDVFGREHDEVRLRLSACSG